MTDSESFAASLTEGVSVEVLLANLRLAPLESMRALYKLLPGAAPTIRGAVHLLGPLLESESEVADAAAELLEAAEEAIPSVGAPGWRTFRWRDVEVPYWELEYAAGDLLFGYEAWPCASILARMLLDASCMPSSDSPVPSVRGRTVLEVGAGVGLTGLACLKCGAEHVTITDGEQRLVDSLREHHSIKNLSVALLDWKHDTGEQQFDIILASDVLLPLCEGHLCVPAVVARRLRREVSACALILDRVRHAKLPAVVGELQRLGLRVSAYQVSATGEAFQISVEQVSPGVYVLLTVCWDLSLVCTEHHTCYMMK